jgi:hypothetical protein
MERCDTCGTEYLRDDDVQGMGLQPTGTTTQLVTLTTCVISCCCLSRAVVTSICTRVLFPCFAGNMCCSAQCAGQLRDVTLDWDDALPESEIWTAEDEADRADLNICIGTRYF